MAVISERSAGTTAIRMYTKGIGYAVEMLLHPQTRYGIADSPAGPAAWIADHAAFRSLR